ncbi:MAG: DUF4339 domain-containing protein [Verrucomicrobiae bacterium]
MPNDLDSILDLKPDQAPTSGHGDVNTCLRNFCSGRAGFLQGCILQDWERAALASYAVVANIRQSLRLFFVLLGINAGIRLFLIANNQAGATQVVMMTDLGGFVIVGILAVITYFVPRWWMVLVTAIAIFPFALGFITGIMAITFLCMLPSLKRANQTLYISGSDFSAIKAVLADIAGGKLADAWPVIGKLGNMAVRSRFFENAAVILAGKTPLNTVSLADARQCVVETDKKGRHILKKWFVSNKLKNTGIMLTEEGASLLKQWSFKNAQTGERGLDELPDNTAEKKPNDNAQVTQQYYIFLNNQVSGPFNPDQLEKMHRDGAISNDIPCCPEGSEKWSPYESISAPRGRRPP